MIILYNYEKLTQQAVIREFNAWNEREAYLRKQQKNDEVKKKFFDIFFYNFFYRENNLMKNI